MITDERFDAVVRAALDHESRRLAARQPSLREQSRRIAERAPSRTVMSGPRTMLAPAGLAMTRVLLVLLLLLGLLAAAYVGAQLLRPDPRFPQSAFGFAAECDLPPRGGLAFDEPGITAILTFHAPDGPDADHESDYHTLYSDGRYVQDISDPGQHVDGTITGSRILVRRMTPAGIEAMVARVAEVGIAPGCRTLATEHAAGGLYAVLPTGAAEIGWSPSGSVLYRTTTAEEELALVELVDDLVRSEAWLPDDSWVDPMTRTATPDHWLFWRLFGRGDEVASDVRDDSEFQQGILGERTLLCRVGDEDDALEIVRAEEQGGTITSVQPVFGTGYDCADLATDLADALRPRPPPSPAPVTGDLSSVDPCSFVTVDALAVLEADATEPRRSGLALGRQAHACIAFDASVTYDEPLPEDIIDPMPAGYRATVTLYPIRLAEQEADQVIGAIFGTGLEPLDDRATNLWIKGCPEEAFDFCSITVAGWSNGHLLVFEFTTASDLAPTPDNVMNREPLIRDPLALSFAEAVLAAVD